jgi:phosphotransferase system enzyme I (PtsI)
LAKRSSTHHQASGEIRIKGIGVSPGIVHGRVHVISNHPIEPLLRLLPEGEIEAEVERFRDAVEATRVQLRQARERLVAEVGKDHAYILDVHIMLLDDQMLVAASERRIREEKINAEGALRATLNQVAQVFSEIEDVYLRERNADIEHTGQQILRNLVGQQQVDLASLTEPVIAVAHDFSPADTASMEKSKVTAFATNVGSRTSHTAIMARALEIPAVVGLERVTLLVRTGDEVIVDGNRGEVIIHPSAETVAEYVTARRRYLSYRHELVSLKEFPAETTDGYRIALTANLEIPEELPGVREHGAQGIGLYRTEFIYLNRRDIPSEEEHYRLYRDLAEYVSPGSATIRTLDLGGDKLLAHFDMPVETNPAMGLRAIRLCLNRTDIFRDQLRGILRASAHGNLKVMFPMISGLPEVRYVKTILHDIMDDLSREGVPFDRGIEIGVMIEIPSAALMADELAREVDFFSIGTNDLIQYTIAIDRVNEHVAYLYEPLHPAVLKLIAGSVQAAHNAGIKISMCGEMAGEPLYTLVLLGMGIDELSMNPLAIPRVKKILRSVSLAEAREVTHRVMKAGTGVEGEEYLKKVMSARFPGDITLDGTQVCLL